MEIHHGKIQNLSEHEVMDLFKENHLGHLGCQKDGEVYVIPITYAFEDNYIYSHSKDGKKIEMMKRNPNICLQVEKVYDLFHWKSAIAWGNFEQLKGEMASQGMRVLVKKLIKLRHIERAPSLEVDFEAMLESTIIYRFRVDKSSGRYESEGFKP